MTFYIDIILIENIIMNYIIILTTGIICKANIKHIRILISSTLGGIYAIMLYINFKIYNSQITKIFLSVCMVYIAFNSKNLKNIFKQLIIFYLTSFCFGGAAYYLLYCVNPSLIKSANGMLVGTYPIKIGVLGAILGFFIINVSFKLIKSRLTKKDIIYNVDICYKNIKRSIKVILDTGNLLIDPITRSAVMIVESEKLKEIVPDIILNNTNNFLTQNIFEDIDKEIKSRCSLIPFSSIGNSNGIIIGFRPDYIIVHTEEGEEVKNKVIIGIYNNKLAKNELYSGLIGLNLLNKT